MTTQTMKRALLAAALILTMTTVAHAGKRRVAVEPFDGPGKLARRAHAAVTEIVQRDHELVDPDEPADAIVSGVVRRKGKRVTLVLTVRAAATGETVDTLRVPLRGGKLAGAARARLEGDLLDLIAWVEPAPAPEPEPVPTLVEPTVIEPDVEPEPRVSRGVELERPRDPARPTLELGAGVSVISRDLSFSHQASLAMSERPLGYDGSPVGGLYLAGELYPAALAGRAGDGALGNLGVAFAFDRAMSVTSRHDDGAMEREFDTSQVRMGVGVRYRVMLGNTAVKAAAGYNKLSHDIDTGGAALALPNVSYSYLDLGAGVRHPLTDRVAVTGDARYLNVLGAGAIVEADAYGAATVNGVDLDAGLQWRATDRISVRGGVRYLRMGFSFEGTGAMSTDLDGDPDQDVGGASDVYLGGYLLAGVAY